MKYGKQKIDECAKWVVRHGLMDYGGAKLNDFCKEMGIDNKTYRLWMKKPEFNSAITDAKEVFKRALTHDIAISLSEAAKGYEREETETEFKPNAEGEPTIVRMRKKKLFVQPNVGAAIFLLTNLDPEHYQNRQRNDVLIKKDDEKEMSIEEIDAELARLDKLEKDADE